MKTTRPVAVPRRTIFQALALLGLSLLLSATAFAAETYQYTGKGTVTFTHAQHGTLLGCASCHTGETPAKISIENKQQGHDLCLSCHKEQAKQGKINAPTKCNDCHKK